MTCIGEIMKILSTQFSKHLWTCLNSGLDCYSKLKYIKLTGTFLIEIMSLMFIPAAVGIINRGINCIILLCQSIITIITTFVVMIVSGKVTIRPRRGAQDGESTRS